MSHEELDVIWEVLEGLGQCVDTLGGNIRRLANAKAHTGKTITGKTVAESVRDARQNAKDTYR